MNVFPNALYMHVALPLTVILNCTNRYLQLPKQTYFSVRGKNPLFTRFSTVAGGAGSVDTPRDVRGFAVKFYTKKAIGTWWK